MTEKRYPLKINLLYYRIEYNGAESGRFIIPPQLLQVCRFLNEEGTPFLYGRLRVSSYSFDEALQFVRSIGPKNASLIDSLEIIHSLDWRGADVARLLKDNSNIMNGLKNIKIGGSTFYFDMISRIELLQKLINMLSNDPAWASHRISCAGFDSIALDRFGTYCTIKLFKHATGTE